MINSWKGLFFLIPFSFLLGVGWGLKLTENKNESKHLGHLKVLTEKNFIPQVVIDDFESKHNIKIHITLAQNSFDLIKKILNPKNNFDLVQGATYNSNFIKSSKYKLKLDFDRIKNSKNISSDFSQLNNDFFKIAMPVLWDIDFFVKDKQIRATSLKTMMSEKKLTPKLYISSEPDDIYFLSTRLGYVIKQWVKTGQTQKIQTALQHFFKKTSFLPPKAPLESSKNIVFQTNIKNGHDFVKLNDRFEVFLPDEKATLMIFTFSINEATTKLDLSYKFLNYLLTKEGSQYMSQANNHPTVNLTLKNKNNPQMQANFLRHIQLSKITVPYSHFGYESTWIEALKGLNHKLRLRPWRTLSSVRSKKNIKSN